MQHKIHVNQIHCIIQHNYDAVYDNVRRIEPMFAPRTVRGNLLVWNIGDNYKPLTQVDLSTKALAINEIQEKIQKLINQFGSDKRLIIEKWCTVPDENCIYVSQSDNCIDIKLAAWGYIQHSGKSTKIYEIRNYTTVTENCKNDIKTESKTFDQQTGTVNFHKTIASELKKKIETSPAPSEVSKTTPKTESKPENNIVQDVNAQVESHKKDTQSKEQKTFNYQKYVLLSLFALLSFLIGLALPSPLFDGIISSHSDTIVLKTQDTSNLVFQNGTYSGGVVEGTRIRHGYGRLETENGSVYEGEWENDILVYGINTNKASVYTGSFDNALHFNGFGIIRYSDEYINGKKSQGLSDSEIIAVYVGNWQKDYKHGIGRSIRIDGSMEFGIYKQGLLQKTPNANYRIGGSVYGIDASHFQKNIDWDNLALFCDKNGKVFNNVSNDKSFMQPIFFVYLKATEGATVKDETYIKRAVQADRHGIAKGAYHFLHLGTPIDAQLKNFFETVSFAPGDLPPAIDVELENEIIKYGVDTLQSMTLKFLTEVESRFGIRPIIYTRESIRNKYLNNPRFDKYQFWISRYNANGPDNFDWQMWQTTEHGRCNGYNSEIDINLFRGDYEAFKRYLSD